MQNLVHTPNNQPNPTDRFLAVFGFFLLRFLITSISGLLNVVFLYSSINERCNTASNDEQKICKVAITDALRDIATVACAHILLGLLGIALLLWKLEAAAAVVNNLKETAGRFLPQLRP